MVGSVPAPDVVDELFTHQTLLGAWPLDPRFMPDFAERVRRYVVKAARESGRHSNWITPHAPYEEAWGDFAVMLGGDDAPAGFRASFGAMRDELALRGAMVSLAQCVLKALSPGVPDIYWGNDGWDFSLVDPDNRRPVDFAASLDSFRTLPSPGEREAAALLAGGRNGGIKRFVQRESLRLRRDFPGLFTRGEFLALSSESDGFVAFARRRGEAAAIVIVSRGWGDGAAPFARGGVAIEGLPRGEWREAFTARSLTLGDSVDVADALRTLPVAALVTGPSE